jgi:hypothetical protein
MSHHFAIGRTIEKASRPQQVRYADPVELVVRQVARGKTSFGSLVRCTTASECALVVRRPEK